MTFYDPVADFYSRTQVGGSIGIFHGSRKQLGGGIFATIQRFALPILRRIDQKLIGLAPSVGSKALEVVKDTLADVRSGKRFGEAIKSNVSSKIQNTLAEQGIVIPDDEGQKGSGRRRHSKKRRRATTVKRQKVTAGKKSINRVRKHKKKSSHKKKKTSAYRDIFATK